MIDRQARNQVIAAFEDYLDDRITSFGFEKRLDKIDSEDQTVNEVIITAGFYYDEFSDHKIQLSKSEWDYFQRLILILRSDAELTTEVSMRWSWDHGLALAAFAVFVGISLVVGWGGHLLAWAIPFGILSILIDLRRQRSESSPSLREIACVPFESFSQMRSLRRQVSDFEKQTYRKEIASRGIRSKAEESIRSAFAYCSWILFGPLVLLFQGFSSVKTQKLAQTS